MNKQFGALVAAGGLLIAAKAAAQNAPVASYSANAAITSPTVSPAARQAMQARIEAANAKFRANHGDQSPEQFGLQCCQISQIPDAAFSPRDTGDTWIIDSLGYMGTPANGGQVYAPVLLPSGVKIVFLDLYFYDTDPTFDLLAGLSEYKGGGTTGPPHSTGVISVSSNGSSGYGYASSAPFSYTVNNNVAYDSEAAQLMVSVIATTSANNSRFKAVDLWWMRQLSPAPNTATFTDVPTGHPFFAFVEALAAAGITVGYPDGRFGVDDPITRGQMAVFLAKALGLFWSY